MARGYKGNIAIGKKIYPLKKKQNKTAITKKKLNEQEKRNKRREENKKRKPVATRNRTQDLQRTGAYRYGGSKVQVTFPQFRVQVTMIQINE